MTLPSHGIFITNPVYILQNFCHSRSDLCAARQDYQAEEIPLSVAACNYLAAQGIGSPSREKPCPGVVGLIYDRDRDIGLVTSLECRLADLWDVAPNLPFREIDARDCLSRLLQSSGLPDIGGEELFAFTIKDTGCIPSIGHSMTIGGLMAILKTMGGDKQGVLRAACSIVEPGQDGELRCVATETIPKKLQAFAREHGQGSLLIRSPQATAEHDAGFEVVWTPGNFADLARSAEEAGLLEPFRQQAELDQAKFASALQRLEHLVFSQYEYQTVLDRAQRLIEHPRDATVRAETLQRARQLILDLHRHLGRFSQATILAKTEYDRIETNPDSTYDEQMKAIVNVAASLFDAHCFTEGAECLQPWLEHIRDDPQIFSPIALVMIWNTLGRLVSMCGGDAQKCFQQTIRLQTRLGSQDLARTIGYQVLDLLRNGRLKKAAKAIRKGNQCEGREPFSMIILAFAEADLARRNGEMWSDPGLDKRQPSPGPVGHPMGRYFQATARQTGRKLTDRVHRLKQAIAFFELDASDSQTDLLSFLIALLRLRIAAEEQSSELWIEQKAWLSTWFCQKSNHGFQQHYRKAWKQVLDEPNIDAVEQVLEQVPYF